MKHLLKICIVLIISLTACKARNTSNNCYDFSEKQIVVPDSVSEKHVINTSN